MKNIEKEGRNVKLDGIMSKFGEWMKLIPKFLGQPEKIIEGWINDAKLEAGKLSEEDMEIVLTRRSICSTCPFNSFNLKKDDSLYKELYGKSFYTDREDMFCGCCQCPLSKKTASLASNCGIESLNLEKNLNLELKWKAKNSEN